MRLSVKVGDAIAAIERVRWTVENKSPIPILSNVLMVANGKLRFTATDMDAWADSATDAHVTEPGKITVNAKHLVNVLRSLDTDAAAELELVHADGKLPVLAIRGADTDLTLPTLPVADFPLMKANGVPIGSARLTAGDLRDALEATQFAMSSEETRYYLRGLCLEDAEGRLRMAATDGARLGMVTFTPQALTGHFDRLIIPSGTVHGLLKLARAKNIETPVTITAYPGDKAPLVVFTVNGTTITTKVVDGTFPDYQRVIPQANDNQFTVDCARLGKGLKRAMSLAEGTPAVGMAFRAPGELTLFTGRESGSIRERMPATGPKDAPDIGVNARYVLDILAAMKGATITFKYGDPGSPMRIEEPGTMDRLFVQMPMRV